MKLIRYKYPTVTDSHPVNRLFSYGVPSIPRFEKLFDEFFETRSCTDQLSMDLYEDDKNFYVQVELPGLDKEDITVEIDNGTLNCNGYYSGENGDEKKDYSLKRSIAIPEKAAPDNITANYKDGILTVTLAKKEVPEPRQIEVKQK